MERVSDPYEIDAVGRCQEASALGGDVRREAVERLVNLLADDHPFVRWEAGVALASTALQLQRRGQSALPGWAGSTEATFPGLLATMRDRLRSADPQSRAAASDALGLWNHEAATELLLGALSDPDPLVRTSAASALGKLKSRATVRPLVSALQDTSLWVRRAAADALGAIGDARAVPALRGRLTDSETLVRASAICALGHMPTGSARRALARYAQDGIPEIRMHVARGLAAIGNANSLPALQRLSRDNTEVFGESIAQVANQGIGAVKQREQGLWNGLLKTIYAIRYRLERRP